MTWDLSHTCKSSCHTDGHCVIGCEEGMQSRKNMNSHLFQFQGSPNFKAPFPTTAVSIQPKPSPLLRPLEGHFCWLIWTAMPLDPRLNSSWVLLPYSHMCVSKAQGSGTTEKCQDSSLPHRLNYAIWVSRKFYEKKPK